MNERLDENSPQHDWLSEATAVIRDVKDLVSHISVSTQLESNNNLIYLNLTTYENNKYTIELSALGFRIIGKDYDTNSADNEACHERYFETLYALLSVYSSSYQERLGKCLTERLEALVQQQNNDISD